MFRGFYPQLRALSLIQHFLVFPEFALADQFVQLFCPSHEHCLFCGFQIELLPGIYPPGSVESPPDWTEPDITITVEEDGTPTYDKDEEPITISSTASTGQTLNTPVSRTSSVSSSATPSEDFLCVSICSSCANVDPPSGTPPPKAKRYLQGDKAPNHKRVMLSPDDEPYYGDMDLFTWNMWQEKVIDTVNLRQRAGFRHVSESTFHSLADFPIDLAIAGLYGFTSLAVFSTKGAWMSHFWEGPSFNATYLVPDITAAQQQILFQLQVMDYLGPVDSTPDFPGLLKYVGPGKEFGPDTYVQAAIITPRDRRNPQIVVLLYHNMVQQIARYVGNMFGPDWDAQTIGSMAYPVEYINYTPRSKRRVQQWTAAGKAIFQYDPV